MRCRRSSRLSAGAHAAPLHTWPILLPPRASPHTGGLRCPFRPCSPPRHRACLAVHSPCIRHIQGVGAQAPDRPTRRARLWGRGRGRLLRVVPILWCGGGDGPRRPCDRPGLPRPGVHHPALPAPRRARLPSYGSRQACHVFRHAPSSPVSAPAARVHPRIRPSQVSSVLVRCQRVIDRDHAPLRTRLDAWATALYHAAPVAVCYLGLSWPARGAPVIAVLSSLVLSEVLVPSMLERAGLAGLGSIGVSSAVDSIYCAGAGTLEMGLGMSLRYRGCPRASPRLVS
ncbi:hypothetical protein FA95DRAFT_121408 [Auriscalpium vulgare]|uniref:Uncharacterized protein n=1 Tax=Auriscalpium vulgare TaxID=40419 RepID=A0ACB8RNN2_9AGAM|nr:hypothetical protein FA95DRAFT_121408 [Auriscalpium vulgare]